MITICQHAAFHHRAAIMVGKQRARRRQKLSLLLVNWRPITFVEKKEAGHWCLMKRDTIKMATFSTQQPRPVSGAWRLLPGGPSLRNSPSNYCHCSRAMSDNLSTTADLESRSKTPSNMAATWTRKRRFVLPTAGSKSVMTACRCLLEGLS